jgi:hypothetical protein
MTDNNDARAPEQASFDAASTEEDSYLADIRRALETSDLPQFYANSFTVTLGTGDVLIVMKRNQKQIGMVQISYTVAKSLAEALGDLIKRLEERTGNTIMTSKFIEQKMQEDD